MTRVALLVTGKTEEAALHHALKRVFPAVGFVMRPRRDGFTSAVLSSPPLLGTAEEPTTVERLAEVLVAEVDPGRKGEERSDFVVLVDDLEIVNQAWPERAAEHVRAAVCAHIDSRYASPAARDRAYGRVRERCSFHMLAPMVEAYFFAEAAALARAGARRPSVVSASASDVESFLVNEPAFLDPPNHRSKRHLPPWASADRARHPKRYLQFLCDPTGTIRNAYVETKGGRAALRDLEWNAVLAPQHHVRFVRSLILDLACALGEHGVAERFAGDPHPLTWPPPSNNILRNI